MTFRSSSRIVARVVPTTACLALAACSASTAPLTVEVRDAATHQPAAGVIVVADVPSRFHPFSVASILGQTGPESSKAVTDAQGLAHLAYMPERPFRILVFSGDAPAAWTIVDEQPSAKDWTRRRNLVVVPGSEPSKLVLQIRSE